MAGIVADLPPAREPRRRRRSIGDGVDRPAWNERRSAIIGPDGGELAVVADSGQVATVVLDREAPAFHVALQHARPWRAEANQGDIYRSRRVEDVRSGDRTGL
ncbi:hypothetical protein [Dactylosporangium sp. CS-033363]|uniref:hypothetical protein n=1 Tax=Dactylosporangium sp. CS-033363 TaxID=3239935 RepID=UPI003D92F49A